MADTDNVHVEFNKIKIENEANEQSEIDILEINEIFDKMSMEAKTKKAVEDSRNQDWWNKPVYLYMSTIRNKYYDQQFKNRRMTNVSDRGKIIRPAKLKIYNSMKIRRPVHLRPARLKLPKRSNNKCKDVSMKQSSHLMLLNNKLKNFKNNNISRKSQFLPSGEECFSKYHPELSNSDHIFTSLSATLKDQSIRNNSSTCSNQARLQSSLSSENCCDDTTIDELASYFDNLVHIPKKMSTMAEMMYI